MVLGYITFRKRRHLAMPGKSTPNKSWWAIPSHPGHKEKHKNGTMIENMIFYFLFYVLGDDHTVEMTLYVARPMASHIKPTPQFLHFSLGFCLELNRIQPCVPFQDICAMVRKWFMRVSKVMGVPKMDGL